MGRAELALNVLYGIQEQIARLEFVQIAEGLGDEDPVPGIGRGRDGEVVCFGKRRADLKEAERRFTDANADIRGEIERLAKARQREIADRIDRLAES